MSTKDKWLLVGQFAFGVLFAIVLIGISAHMIWASLKGDILEGS